MTTVQGFQALLHPVCFVSTVGLVISAACAPPLAPTSSAPRPAPPTITVTGSVVHTDGTPAAGMTLFGSMLATSVQSDAAGRFKADFIRPAYSMTTFSIQMKAESPDFISSWATVKVSDGVPMNEPVLRVQRRLVLRAGEGVEASLGSTDLAWGTKPKLVVDLGQRGPDCSTVQLLSSPNAPLRLTVTGSIVTTPDPYDSAEFRTIDANRRTGPDGATLLVATIPQEVNYNLTAAIDFVPGDAVPDRPVSFSLRCAPAA